MEKRKVFIWSTVVAESVGVGMIFGYSVGDGTNNAALWVGGLLILLGAISSGMAISSSETVKRTNSQADQQSDNPDSTNNSK